MAHDTLDPRNLRLGRVLHREEIEIYSLDGERNLKAAFE